MAGRHPRGSTARRIGAVSVGRYERTRRSPERCRSPRRLQRRFRNCRPWSGRSGSFKVRSRSGDVQLREGRWRRICLLRLVCCHLRCTLVWLDLRIVFLFCVQPRLPCWVLLGLRYLSSLTRDLYKDQYPPPSDLSLCVYIADESIALA